MQNREWLENLQKYLNMRAVRVHTYIVKNLKPEKARKLQFPIMSFNAIEAKYLRPNSKTCTIKSKLPLYLDSTLLTCGRKAYNISVWEVKTPLIYCSARDYCNLSLSYRSWLAWPDQPGNSKEVL